MKGLQLYVLLTLVIVLFHCERSDRSVIGAWSAYQDTLINAHEPYAAIRLPITGEVSIWNPSCLMIGPTGRIFGCNLTGEVFSLKDGDLDGLEDQTVLFCDVTLDGLRTPTALAHRGWDIYVGTAQQIRVYRDVDRDFVADTSFVFFEEIPFSDHPYEYTSGLTFDSIGNLYCALTTDSWNAGASPDPKKYRGAIIRISPDGKQVERVATGIRSVHSMAFSWDGRLFFVDNRGGQNPSEELNLWEENAHYGHNSAKYSSDLPSKDPILALTTEVAPSQIQFYGGRDLESLYVAFYGPGEYWDRGGLARISIEKQADGGFRLVEIPMVTGLGKLSGLAIDHQGNIYLSQAGKTDYWYYATDQRDGGIYRLVHDPEAQITQFEHKKPKPSASGTIALGKKIFAERACSACHAMDGKTELLGPNLKDIGQIYEPKELLEEIKYPSRRIKPGTAPTKVVTRDGTVFLGRVVHQNETEVQIMLIGNQIKKIPVSEISSTELSNQSMMYEGLLEGLDENEINALLAYLKA